MSAEQGDVRPEGREGMVTVYDSADCYLGCMGREVWERLLAPVSEQGNVQPWRENVERVRVPGLTARQHACLDALAAQIEELDRARLDAACRSIEWQSRAEAAEAAERRYTYTDPSGRKYDWDEHPHTGACRASHNTECWGHARALRAILRAEAAEQRAEELQRERDESLGHADARAAAAIDRAEAAEADALREHDAVERWSLRAEATEQHLEMLKGAWNAHMARCNLEPVITWEQIHEWKNAPSNTAGGKP